MASKWFVGNGPTLADLTLFPSFALSRDYGIDHDDYPTLPPMAAPFPRHRRLSHHAWHSRLSLILKWISDDAHRFSVKPLSSMTRTLADVASARRGARSGDSGRARALDLFRAYSSR